VPRLALAALVLPRLALAALVLPLFARAASAAPKSLTEGYAGCPLAHDVIPLDVSALGSGSPIPLRAVADPTDATISPDGTQLWVTDGADSARFASDAPIWVIDRATDAVVAQIPMGFYNASVAFSDDGQYAIVTSRDASNVTLFPVSLLIPSGTTPLPGQAGAIALDPVSKNLYVCEWLGPRLFELSNGGFSFSRDAFVGTQLSQIVASPDCKGLYVLDLADDVLRVVDRVSLTATRSVPVGQDPSGLDVTRDGRQVVVACRASHDAWIVDTATWLATEIPLSPAASPRDVDIDDVRRRAYVTGGIAGAGDVVFVIDLDTLSVAGTIAVAGCGSDVVAVQPQVTSAALGAAVTDDDADGIIAACDDCPGVFNPLQEDADGNSVGDACDTVTTCAEPSALDLVASATPLRVRRLGVGSLAVSWQDMPGQAASLYAGTIASLHAGTYDQADTGACAIPGGATTLPVPAADEYFLVAGSCGATESSLGRDSFGRERPPASPRCP
jgi:DNA-binding beta-propeller fold protein YncE